MDDLDRQLAEMLGIDVKALEVFEFSNYVESSVENINNNYKKGNKIAYLAILSGIATYKMEKKPGAGHDFFEVVDAIHNCFKKNPQGGYDKGYADGLYALISVSSAKVGSLEQLLRILFYQLDKEKDGTAAFKIDIDDMIAKINALICENREVYRKDYAMFDSWLERYKKISKEKYGLELG